MKKWQRSRLRASETHKDKFRHKLTVEEAMCMCPFAVRTIYGASANTRRGRTGVRGASPLQARYPCIDFEGGINYARTWTHASRGFAGAAVSYLVQRGFKVCPLPLFCDAD
eukprot:gene21074-27955_t